MARQVYQYFNLNVDSTDGPYANLKTILKRQSNICNKSFFLNCLGQGIHTTYYLSSWKAFWHPSWEAVFYLKISRFRTWNFGQFGQISDGPPLPRQKPRLDKLCFSISLMAFWFHWIIPGLPIPPLYMYIEHPEEEKVLLKTQSIKGDNQSTNSVCCKSSDATVDSSQAFLWFSLELLYFTQ